MGTGYTRNDTANNIADGNIINASDLDGEFDAVQSAFNASTGHTHDGTTGEGAPIEVIGPTQDVVATASVLRPKTDNTVDLGTTTLEYKDLFLDGTAHIDTLDVDENASITGTLGVTGTTTLGTANITTGTITTADINGGNIDGTIIGATTAAAITGTTITGTSFVTSGDMTFGDNDKAIFGAGSDLQIYHDGSHSYIKDAGTGNLLIQGANIRLESDTGENFLAAFPNAEVRLYYDSVEKLATTSTGIDVTGTVTADGLTVDGTSTFTSNVFISHNATPLLRLEDTDTALDFDLLTAGSNATIRTKNGAYPLILQTNELNRVHVSGSGSISFYEDTGTTAKFFWDASAESLGIGTNDPATLGGGAKLTVNQAADGNIVFARGASTRQVQLGTTSTTGYINADNTSGGLAFHMNGTERMRIDSSGNVGIGTTSPSAKLSVTGLAMNSASSGVELEGAWPWLKFKDTEANQDSWLQYIDGSNFILKQIDYDDRNSAPSTVGTERMRIDSSGNVGIGFSNPDAYITDNNSTVVKGQLRVQGVTNTAAVPVIGVRDDNTGFYLPATNTLGITTNGSEAMRIDSSGNVGIDFIPKTMTANVTSSLNVGSGTVFQRTKDTYLGSNMYYNASDVGKSISTGYGLAYYQDVTNGAHKWFTSAVSAGSADATHSFSTPMLIDSSGNVGIGATSPSAKLDIRPSNDATNTFRIYRGVDSGYQLDYLNISQYTGDSIFNSVSSGGANNEFIFQQNATERMRIDNSGNVGIGTNGAPTFTAAYGGLHVHSTYPEIHLTGIDSGSGASDGFKIQKNSANHVYLWNYENAFMAFGTNNAERMRIEADGDIQFGTSTNYAWMRPYETTTGNLIISADNGGTGTNGSNILFRTRGANKMIIEHSTGNVGIGTSSPSKKLHISGDRDAILRFENTRTVESGDQILGSLEFYSNDESGTGANVRSRINALTSTGGNSSYLTFSTADGTTDDVEAMRIDSSGNLFVNQTSTGDYTTTVGSSFRSSGFSTHTADANAALLLNRLTSDGDILLFRKDNTTVGSIGTNGGDLTIGTGDTGIRFIDSLDCLLPLNTSTNATRDAAIDIGYNDGGRFKDLYLSGGVYLGGTGAANKLDDYEEGASFTITDQSGAALSLTVSNSGYTKIGQMVHAWYNVTYPITSNTSPARLSLPFTSAFSSSFTGGAVLETSYTGGAIMASVDASTYVRFRNNGLTPLLNSDLSAKNVRFTIHYIAA